MESFKTFYYTVVLESIKDYYNKKKNGNSERLLKDTIALYKQLKSQHKLKPPQSDIGYWMNKDVAQLWYYLNNLPKSKRQQKKKDEWDTDNLIDGARLVKDNKYFTVLEITDYTASRKYGSHTEWCIVANEKHWNEYIHDNIDVDEYGIPQNQNTVFYVLHKTLPKYNPDDSDNDEDNPAIYKKLAFVYQGIDDEWTVWDSADNQLDERGFIDFYISADPHPPVADDNPDLSHILDIIGYNSEIHYDTLTPRAAYMKLVRNQGDPEKLKKIISTDAQVSFTYAQNMQSPFPEGEPAMLESKNILMLGDYFYMFRDRWTTENKEKMQQMFKEQLPNDPREKRLFLRNFFSLRDNGKRAQFLRPIYEDLFKTDIEVLYRYMTNNPNWVTPQMEKQLFNSGKNTYLYYFIFNRTRNGGKLTGDLLKNIIDRLLTPDNSAHNDQYGYFAEIIQKHLENRMNPQQEAKLKNLSDSDDSPTNMWAYQWEKYAQKFGIDNSSPNGI